MKKLLLIFALGLILFVSKTKADNYGGDVSFNFFYSSLSPYGEWIEVDRDLYAWHPYDVSDRWQPYTVGRWIWSDYGWYWDSYEPFGWAVYHYGRWYNDDYYGWLWIPDYDWGPSWVEWRYNDDYVGWAPLPPYAVFRAGVGIHFTYDWHFPVRFWNYVPCTHFYDYDIIRYRVPDRIKHRIFSETRYRNNYDYRDGRVINRSVDIGMIERRIGHSIEERNVSVTNRLRDYEGSRNTRGGLTGDRNRVEVYRPSTQDIRNSRDISNINIHRPERKTSLETSRVEMRDMGRDVNGNSGTTQRDRNRNVAPEGNNAGNRPEIETRNRRSDENTPEVRPNSQNEGRQKDRPARRGEEMSNWNPGGQTDRINGNQQQGRNNQPDVMNERRPENRANNDTRRQEVQSNGNHERNNAPQVRERRTEERRSENPGQNKNEERSNDNNRERRR